MHEVTQESADLANSNSFQYYIAPDPTLLLRNPIVFKTGRLIPQYLNTYKFPEVPTIGSFGFGITGKGFERVILTTQDEFDEAIIRLHIPFGQFCDNDGQHAMLIAMQCKKLIKKPGIKLIINHDFLDKKQLLDFLAQNTINAFFYDKYLGRGISSVIDYAIAVQRPLTIAKSSMFRHIIPAIPSICIEDSTLRQIIKHGFEPLSHFYNDWSETNFIWDYERILEKVFHRQSDKAKNPLSFIQKIQSMVRKEILQRPRMSWILKIKNGYRGSSESENAQYSPVLLPDGLSLNRILDNTARIQYKPSIDTLFTLVPNMMARKIPEANIQQAFVLDTVYKFASKFALPKVLCVGSYEDTAAAALKRLGFRIDEIDPLLNYNLDEFFHKPSTKKGSYHIIFSTSVLEHVKNDELFIKQIIELLTPGGITILTCDYNDHYKPGDRIPQEDFRFYTQKDFNQRILPLLKDCSLVDSPQWDCPDPDFSYGGCQYTFATLVFQKKKI